MTDKEMTATEVRAYWEKLKRPPAWVEATEAKSIFHNLYSPTDGTFALVAKFTDKKLEVLYLKDGEANTKAEFDTPYALKEIFDLKVKVWMPTEWALCAAIGHRDHPPMILDFHPITGWRFEKVVF
jgi:hypothetical protein